jgi:hypothetical protein
LKASSLNEASLSPLLVFMAAAEKENLLSTPAPDRIPDSHYADPASLSTYFRIDCTARKRKFFTLARFFHSFSVAGHKRF